MKNFSNLLSGFFFLFFCNTLNAQIYVNHLAQGANDGSSWEDAFTEIYTAFSVLNDGDQIWVAQGDYIAGPDRISWIEPTANFEIYGGFNGTETSLDQRDFEANISTVTGDVQGNDVDLDFNNGREDNCKHLMVLDTFINNTTVIDGIVFSHGHTDDSSASGNDRRAGAVLSFGGPVFKNCTFTENYGHFASSLYCRLGFSSNTKLLDCTFKNNLGGTGGACYILRANDVVISNCNFEENISENRGGAIAQYSSSVDYESCDFLNNQTETTGGAIHFSSDSAIFVQTVIKDCQFLGNRTNEGWGGAVTVYGDEFGENIVTFDECHFEENYCMRSGGGMSAGFEATVNLEDVEFIRNTSEESGGAIFLQNSFTTLNAQDSRFELNIANEANGGAIRLSAAADQVVNVDKCEFLQNKAYFGGAIDCGTASSLQASNSIFQENISNRQGGALNFNNSKSTITNCLLSSNIALDIGVGGAISVNQSDSGTDTLTIVNCTIADNVGQLSGGIATWSDSDTSTAIVRMINTIMANEPPNFGIELGQINFLSMGGNFANDESFNALFNTFDFPMADPLLAEDYTLTPESFAINAGIEDALVPETDINGDARVGQLDCGAFEYPILISTTILENSQFIKVLPNPADFKCSLQLSDELEGELSIKVIDLKGSLIFTKKLSKDAGATTEDLDISSFSEGVYWITVYKEGRLIARKVLVVQR